MRCDWSNTNPWLTNYHDTEWGVPVHEDRMIFEHLALDSFQAGLSWLTILKKRENFRMAFNNFNIEEIAAYDEFKIQELLGDAGIIRNRMKIEAVVNNAKKVLEVQRKFKSFDKFIWEYTNGKPIQNKFQSMSDIPPRSPVSDKMSLDLKKLGFKFVGSTICYAFMQSIGMVNDHIVTCFRYEELNNY
jgi:DNA-3-methyladenine glycosylase I